MRVYGSIVFKIVFGASPSADIHKSRYFVMGNRSNDVLDFLTILFIKCYATEGNDCQLRLYVICGSYLCIPKFPCPGLQTLAINQSPIQMSELRIAAPSPFRRSCVFKLLSISSNTY